MIDVIFLYSGKGREGKGREGKGTEIFVASSERYQNFVSLYFEEREFSSYSRILVEIFAFLCNFPVNIPKVIV